MTKYPKIILFLFVLSSCSTNHYIKEYCDRHNLMGKVNKSDSSGFLDGNIISFSNDFIYEYKAKHGILDSHYYAYTIRTGKLVEMGMFIPNQTPLKAMDYIETKGKYSNATINFPNETNCEVYEKAFYPNGLPKSENYYSNCHLIKTVDYYPDTLKIRSVWLVDLDSIANYYKYGKFKGFIKDYKDSTNYYSLPGSLLLNYYESGKFKGFIAGYKDSTVEETIIYHLKQ